MNEDQIRRNSGFWQCVNRIRQFVWGILFPPRCPGCDALLEQEDDAYRHVVFPDNITQMEKFAAVQPAGTEAVQAGTISEHPYLKNTIKGCCKRCQKKLFLIGPQYCLHCGKQLDRAESEFCPDCRKKDLRQSFRQGRSIFGYRGAAPKMMYRFKYAGRQEYARFFALMAILLYGDWLAGIRPDVIIPVPMYCRKQRRRGYNQAEIFGRELGQLLSIPCCGKYVHRIRNTCPMKELDNVMRVRNIAGAFTVFPDSLPYERVLLVDDIYTTGATADEVTRTLMSAGVREVYFLSVTIGKGC